MDIRKWILENLPNNPTILEAGTADGTDTLFFAHYFPNGMIYGFEPVPNHFNDTLNKISGRNNVIVYNLALSEDCEPKEIHVSDRFGQDWGSSSLLKPKEHLTQHPEITFNKTITVDCTNLDVWIKDKNINRINLIWLDIQGYEPVVLGSSPITMSMSEYIYAEVSLIDTYEGVQKYPEFKKFMEENGFEAIHEELPWQDMGNVLFKNKNIIK
jgi:FkbM family methyltransferase